MGVQEIPAIVGDLRSAFESGRTRPLAWRRKQLLNLKTMLRNEETRLTRALQTDLGKSRFEGWITDLKMTLWEIDHALKSLGKWTSPEKVPTPLHLQAASSEIRREPVGVVLVIAPWNYPVQLALGPAVAALAAGNCVVIKPSEVTSACSEVLAELLPRYLDPAAVRVVTGGVPETTALLEQRFDHILFTGSEPVARIVMAAAARHLTPVTLELGGKAPAIVDKTVKLPVTARRLLWGKILNAGQTCVAPDYVLVHRSQRDGLIEELRSTLRRFLGDDPRRSPDFARIVNERHFDRLEALLEGQTVAFGGERDRRDRYFAPTVVVDPSPDSPLMREEIFGPILPVLTWQTLDEAIDFVRQRPDPLALYVFSDDVEVQERILDNTRSGGVGINQTVLHLTSPELPFGGTGRSGFGAWHGKAGFEALSHRRSVMRRSTRIDPPMLYPPHGEASRKWARRLL
jgi:aldehyde dehydrogenase (NAD+)